MEVEYDLDGILEGLGNVEHVFDEFVLDNDLSDICEQLEDDAQAKLHTALSYMAASVCRLELMSKGVDVHNHPIAELLNRVKQKVGKVRQKTKEAKMKKTLEIDKEAAIRFIAHAVDSDVSKEIREHVRKKAAEQNEGD